MASAQPLRVMVKWPFAGDPVGEFGDAVLGLGDQHSFHVGHYFDQPEPWLSGTRRRTDHRERTKWGDGGVPLEFVPFWWA